MPVSKDEEILKTPDKPIKSLNTRTQGSSRLQLMQSRVKATLEIQSPYKIQRDGSSAAVSRIENLSAQEPQLFDVDTFNLTYEEIRQIGEGGAARVKLCKKRETGDEVAVKMMARYDIEKEMVSKSEYDLLASVKPHPNIVRPIEFISTESWTYLVMELAQGQELQEYVEN